MRRSGALVECGRGQREGPPAQLRRVNWKYAEGFQRHCHLGFAEKEKDPLREILKRYVRVNPNYEKLLRRPT